MNVSFARSLVILTGVLLCPPLTAAPSSGSMAGGSMTRTNSASLTGKPLAGSVPLPSAGIQTIAAKPQSNGTQPLATASTPLASGNGQALPKAAGPGSTAPNFALGTLDGKTQKSSDLRGQNTVLVFTNPGSAASQNYQSTADQLQSKLGDKNAKVIQVQTGSAASNDPLKKNEKNHQQKMQTVVDTNDKLAKKLGVDKTATAVVLDKDGKVVYKGAIDDDAKQTKKPEDRKDYVGDAVKAANKGEKPKVSQTQSEGDKIQMKTSKTEEK
jgi:peroxiredoxin